MTHTRLIVLLGVVVGSCVPAAAQRPPQQFAMVYEPAGPTIMTRLQALPGRQLASSFFLLQNLAGPSARFTLPNVEAHERDHSFESTFPIEYVKTVFVTESRFSVAQVWGGRLKLDCFVSTLHIGNMMLGPSVAFRPPGHFDATRSVDLYGISLRFPFGPRTYSGRSTHLWRDLSRILGRR